MRLWPLDLNGSRSGATSVYQRSDSKMYSNRHKQKLMKGNNKKINLFLGMESGVLSGI